MKTSKLQLLFFILISFTSYSMKFTSLKSGNYNNKNDVWSKNGVTPCGCFPGNSVISDTIIIKHPITLISNLSLSTLSNLQIIVGGQIIGSTCDITLTNSKIIANSGLSVEKFSIGVGSEVNVNGSSLISSNGMDNYGSLIADFSNIINIGGNIETFATGLISFINGSRWEFSVGNYKNSGTTHVCATCCLSASSGNIQNFTGGSFTGSGAVKTSVGSIKNYGTWSASLQWCSFGVPAGMVSPENCAMANDMCKFVPLPTQLVYFNGYNDENQNTLVWETASEANSDHYSIEKSSDGINWSTIGTINSMGINSAVSNYSFHDDQDIGGLKYYKLAQIDKNGEESFSNMLSLINTPSSDIVYFPNPTKDNVTIQLPHNHAFKTLNIADPLGRQIRKTEIGDTFTFNVQLPLQKGLYFIQAEGEGITTTYTLMKL